MRLLLPSIVLLLLFVDPAAAQNRYIEGLWQGTITIGGIQSQTGYKFELYLQAEGDNRLVGRAYIYLDDDQVIETTVKGNYYGDRSIDLLDIEFIEREGQSVQPPFYRKYQFIHQKSIFERNNKIIGYWQQVTPHYFSEKRERGRITLERIKVPGA